VLFKVCVPQFQLCLGEDRCRVGRLALIAGKDTMDASHLRARRHRAHACSAALERPIRNRHVRINHDLRMSDEKDRWHCATSSSPSRPPA
jgi:hypothetical protein